MMRKLLVIFLSFLFTSTAFSGPLLRGSTPAERVRGCVWASIFDSEENVEKEGGSITGSPVFSGDGVTLDGSSDYLTYNLTGREFDSSVLTIVFEFTPDFAYDSGTNMYFASADSGGGAGGHNFRFAHFSGYYGAYFGGSAISGPTDADVQSYWRSGQRNIFVIAADSSGDNDFWLSGTKVKHTNTAWTAYDDVIDLYIGCRYSLSQKFDGTIHRVQIYNQKLSDLECEQISSGTVYSYPQGKVWDFTVAHGLSDAAGENTLTAYNSPTKLDVHGYELDGVDQYLAGTIDTSIFNQDPISFVMEFTPHHAVDSANNYYYFRADEGGATHATLMYYNTGTYFFYFGATEFVTSLLSANVAPAFRRNQRNVVVISATSGDTSVWWNNTELVSNDNTAWTKQADVDRFTLARHPDAGGFYFPGQIHSFRVIPAQLSRMQAVDITNRLLKQANRK